MVQISIELMVAKLAGNHATVLWCGGDRMRTTRMVCRFKVEVPFRHGLPDRIQAFLPNLSLAEALGRARGSRSTGSSATGRSSDPQTMLECCSHSSIRTSQAMLFWRRHHSRGGPHNSIWYESFRSRRYQQAPSRFWSAGVSWTLQLLTYK
jgi:hypothetical protein